jgi:hypothetical protein
MSNDQLSKSAFYIYNTYIVGFRSNSAHVLIFLDLFFFLTPSFLYKDIEKLGLL